MRKVFPFLIVLLFFTFNKTFAYSPGYFDNNDPLLGSGKFEKLFDNDLKTSVWIPGYGSVSIIVDLENDVEITDFYYYGTRMPHIVISFIDASGNTVKTYASSAVSVGWNNVMPTMLGIKKITLTNKASGSYDIQEFDIRVANEPVIISPVENLNAIAGFDYVDLTWNNPTNHAFEKILIKRDGVELAELGAVESYSINGLDSETKYVFEVFAKYLDGTLSSSEKVTVTTKKVGEVIGLTANAEYDRVYLKWGLPESEEFKHVNIYRETLKRKMFDNLLSLKSVSAAGDKIFETNGTYFKDLTVAAETKYEYVLTTETANGTESAGVKKVVQTPKKPLPEMDGEETEVDESGNYTFKWTSPSSGKVKIIVGGKEYKTVNAADLKITIPAADMKFTIFGAPDVKLIPIDEDGNEGLPTAPPAAGGGSGGGEVVLPFGPSDLLSSTFGFIGILSGFILLVMAIYLVPRLILVIKKTIDKNKEKTGRRI